MTHRTPSSRRPPHARRVLTVASVIAALGASVLVASTTNLRPEFATSAANAALAVTNSDISMALRMADLTPENLAAAGVGRLEFGQLADAALTYCAQADHSAAYAKANKNLNILRANATKVPAKRVALTGDGAPTTMAQAQTRIDDMKNAAFTFISTPLDTETKAKLATIRSNNERQVPAPYKLMTEMTDKKWLELRNALSAERIARKQNKPVPQSVSSILGPSNANTAVAAAKLGYDTRLASIKDEWKTRLPIRPANASPSDHP